MYVTERNVNKGQFSHVFNNILTAVIVVAVLRAADFLCLFLFFLDRVFSITCLQSLVSVIKLLNTWKALLMPCKDYVITVLKFYKWPY